MNWLMLKNLRKLMERTLIGDSVPALVRWGKHVPRSVIRRLQAESFRDVVRYTAAHQKFFARKLAENHIDIRRVRSPEDLGGIFTTADDLLHLPAEDFLCRPPQAVFETTGTSGSPKRVYFGYDELDLIARYEAAAMYENGVRPGDRVVCTFDAGYWISSWVSFLACKQIGALCSAVGKPHPREVYSRLAAYRYNVILADPTWLVSLSAIAEKEGTFPIKLIFTAGDRMNEASRAYVQDVWKAPVILGYGSTEQGGGAGMECKRRNGIHLDEYNLYFELLEPDADGYGELVVTTLSRRTMPLIRYRVSDVTRFIDGPCACGTTLRRIEPIRGRRDEMVVMGAGNLHPGIFDQVLRDVDGISPHWQVAVKQNGLTDVLEFRVEPTNGVAPAVIQRAIERNLESRYPDLWANRQCGMYELALRINAPGVLGQGRKPKRLVDER